MSAACVDGCGRPVHAQGMSAACHRRWDRAGRPASGPPPPLTPAERATRMNTARLGPADPYDQLWAQGEPERRAGRARNLAADLIRCVAASDAEGVRLLLHKVEDWFAFSVVLAECADPVRTAVVTGQLTQREEREDAA